MQNKKFSIFIIAGEVSGDVLGARIMRQMPDVRFIGIGGENMVAAGLQPLFPMSDLAVMGIIEVLGHLKTLTRRIRQTADAIIESEPDIVLTIDAPGFAKNVIKTIHKNPNGKRLIAKGLQFHHVVAPQVWAWRAGRAKKYAKIFNKLYAFFDFEVPYFTKYGLNTVAVGHPIADGLIGKYKEPESQKHEKIITLIPGSRMSEVKRLMPIFHDVVHQLVANGYTEYKFVIPTVETTTEYVSNYVKNWRIKPELVSSDKRYDIYSKTYIAIAASGTVSAELAMLHIPTIVVYKMNPVTVWFAHRLIKINWVSLVNILLNKSVYPEYLGGDATVENILNAVQQLTIPAVRNKMIESLKTADAMWYRNDGAPAELIAKSIYSALSRK